MLTPETIHAALITNFNVLLCADPVRRYHGERVRLRSCCHAIHATGNYQLKYRLPITRQFKQTPTVTINNNSSYSLLIYRYWLNADTEDT